MSSSRRPGRLTTLREAKGLTRTELAFHLGMSSEMLRALEAGRRRPTLDVLRKTADFFDLSLDEAAEVISPRASTDPLQRDAL